MNDYLESDNTLQMVSYYRFRSGKSKLFYLVRIEVYKEHVYGVKFFLKQMLDSPKKYSHLTNTFEPRTIIYSIFRLMLAIFAKDSQASFMFIGNPDEDGNKENTRRFRLYCRLVSSKISDRHFKHLITEKYSLYILANRSRMSDNPFFAEQLINEFVNRFIQEEPSIGHLKL